MLRRLLASLCLALYCSCTSSLPLPVKKKPAVQDSNKAYEIRESTIKTLKPLTFEFKYLSGISRSTFIVPSTSDSMIAVEFFWGVRPDAEAEFVRAFRITENGVTNAEDISASYDFELLEIKVPDNEGLSLKFLKPSLTRVIAKDFELFRKANLRLFESAKFVEKRE